MKQTSSIGIMDFIRPHKGGFLCSVVLSVLGVASGIVPYFAVAKMINLLIVGEQDFSIYLLWCSVALVAFIMKSVFHGFSTKASHEATFAVLSEIRRRIASKLTKVSMGYLTDTPSGKLKSSMVERVEQMEVPLAHIIPEMTSNLLVPVAVIIYLFVLDWRMALVSLITIPIGILCYMAQMKEYPKKYGAVVQAGKHMSATTVESLIKISDKVDPTAGLGHSKILAVKHLPFQTIPQFVQRMEDGRKRPAPVMVKQAGNIFKQQIRRSFCRSQPGNFKEQGTSWIVESSTVSSNRKRLTGKSAAQQVEVGDVARIGFSDIFTKPLSFRIEQGFIASVGLFVDFAMAYAGKPSGAGEPFPEPANAGEQVDISYGFLYHTPCSQIGICLKHNQWTSPLSLSGMESI